MPKQLQSLIFSLGLLSPAMLVAQMMPAPPPVGETEITQIEATVQNVNLENRLLTLRLPDERVVITKVSPKVEDLGQFEAGDEVAIDMHRAVLLQAKKVGKDAQRRRQIISGGLPHEGAPEKPEGVTVREVRVTVEILGVDPFKKSISFRDPEGRFREISVNAPHLRATLDTFEKGDFVEVVFREAFAVAVEPK